MAAPPEGWIAALVRCVICTYEWTCVAPETVDESSLECPSCGAMDSELTDESTEN